jgi:thioredoxin reductase (NADPH)
VSIWANVAVKHEDVRDVEDVVVVGSGPAGYTAALYAGRARFRPLVVEGVAPGGLLQGTDLVENFPGYPKGILGPSLVADLREQAERFGARFLARQVERLALAGEPGGRHRVWAGDREIAARTVILAMGAAPKTLGVPGEAELGGGRGVAYCAVCEAPLYAGKDTVVVGGGDSAMEEALGLARHARSVVLVHRRRAFTASPIMRERVLASPTIRVLAPYVVDAFAAGADGKLAHTRVRSVDDGSVQVLSTEGAFVAIGHEPRSALVRELVDVDARGYVRCRPGTRETSVPGVFACGDLVDSRYRQAVTAAGSGCEAALDAQRWLETHGGPR